MNRKKTYTLCLLAGITVLVIVFSPVVHYKTSLPVKKTELAEKQQEKPADETQISLPTFSLPSPLQIQVNLESYCLFEIFFPDTGLKETAFPETRLLPQKLFQTLFRVIISPNAP